MYHCWPGWLCCMLFFQVRQGISPVHPRVCHAELDPFLSLPRSYVSQLTQHEQHHSSYLDSLESIHYPTGRFCKSQTLHQHKKNIRRFAREYVRGMCGRFAQPLLCHDDVCVRTFKDFLQIVVVCVHQQQNKFYSSTTIWMTCGVVICNPFISDILLFIS